MKAGLVVLVLLLALWVGCGQPRNADTLGVGNDTVPIKKVTAIPGERLFKDRCASCHRLRNDDKLVANSLGYYATQPGVLKAQYKFNTKYHSDTLLTYWDLDTLDYYAYNYK